MTAPSRWKPARSPSVGWHGRWLVGMFGVVGRVLWGLMAAAVLVVLVVGVPWALWHYIGWPLPDHVPSWDEVQAVLLSPMSTAFLLDVLACLCWIAWAAFVIDVVRCALDATRGTGWPELRSGGPVHTVAAILLGAIVLSLSGNRNLGQPSTRPSSITATAGSVTLADPSWRAAPAPAAAAYRMASLTVALPDNESRASTVDTVLRPATAVVQEPHNGVHDSLWRIAQRELGDGARWPEIFALNKGKPQPNGGRLTNPNVIFPNEELMLPAEPAAEQPPEPAPPGPPPPATTAPSTPPPLSPTTAAPAPSAPTREQAPPAELTTTDSRPPARDTHHPNHGIGWDPGVFVGLGLAAAVSAALLLARRRSRRTYRPGSGRREDLPVAPVVSRLRLAHLRATAEPDDDQDGPSVTTPPTLIIGPAGSNQPAPPQIVIPELGVRDGREIALDLAVARGFGVVGPGAPAAARALLLALLTRPFSPADPPAAASVLIPVEDLTTLLGTPQASVDIPTGLRLVADLDAALEELDAEILRRAHDDCPAGAWSSVIVVASPSEGSTRRLQAMLDNGAPLGILGVLLGQWRSGVTAHIRGDGTVVATNPGVGEALEGTQMFRLPGTDTRDLLRLLRQAQPDSAHHQPTPDDDRGLADAVPEPESHPVPAQQATNSLTSATDTLGNASADDQSDPASSELEITRARLLPEPPPPGDGEEMVRAGLPIRDLSGSAMHEPIDDQNTTPITVTILGPLNVHWRHGGGEAVGPVRDITAAFPPRQRELLVFLALHPDGVHRDAVAATLWADNPPERPTNALNTALSRLRGALSTATAGALSDITVLREGRYQLNPTVVEVDYWHFTAAMAARRAATSATERIAGLKRVVAAYTGRLADGLETEWIDGVREATARDAIDAVAALARAMVDTDPEYTLNLLETARAWDPHNELLYRDIMRLQERLGRLDAIPRTLTLLATRLAEIDEQPSPDALRLATRLQHHRDPPAATADRPPRREERRGTAAAS